MLKKKEGSRSTFLVITGVGAILTLVWCISMGARNAERGSLALATCLASFAVGSLAGFVFTIFGDEIEPLGKIRDGMIALASGIAGLTIAELRPLSSMIGGIQLFANESPQSSWFALLFVTTYLTAGFYFMYFLRKLLLNPALARSRIEMERLQASGRASSIATEIAKTLRPSILLGRGYIDEVIEDGGKPAERVRAELTSEAVRSFLEACEKDASEGSDIPPEAAARAATLHYYRTYLEKDPLARAEQQERAIEWITRVLLRDPLDPDFQIKLADVYGMQKRYDETVSILERLERDEDSPQYVQQWLGYYLLFIDGREQDAIKHHWSFMRNSLTSPLRVFNASCGYAQLYSVELRTAGTAQILGSENRRQSLDLLKQAVRLDPDNRATAQRYISGDESFNALAHDEGFLRIIEG